MKRLILIAIATMGMTSTALAAYDNIYLDFGLGYLVNNRNFSTTASATNTAAIPPLAVNMPRIQWRNRYNNGYEANMAVGATFCRCFRLEGEYLIQLLNRKMNGSYDLNESVSFFGRSIPAGSQLNNPIKRSTNAMFVSSLLANGYYDFRNCTKWTPSLGGGIGIAWGHSKISKTDHSVVIAGMSLPTLETSPTLSGSAFAWQVKAQLAYEVDSHISVVGQYRLFGTTSFNSSKSRITLLSNTPAATSLRASGGRVKGLLNNSVDLILRYTI